MGTCPMTTLVFGGVGVFSLYLFINFLPWYGYVFLSAILFGLWFKFVDADLTTYFYGRFFGVNTAVVMDRVIWVIGASSGIGEELARQYAAQGAKVILSARREDELKRIAKELNQRAKHDCLVVPLDILDFNAHKKAFDLIIAKYGHIDLLVLNAARTQRALAEETVIEVTREMFELNVFSQLHLVQTVLPHFLERKSGSFLVTSSVAGKVSAPIISSYNATKFALQGYFDALRLETVDRGLKVYISCPGPIATSIEANGFSSKPGVKLGTSKEDLTRKMPVERCAHLMLVQQSHGIDEAWISINPFLLFTYLTQYAPDLARWFGKRFVGPARTGAWRRGEDIYDTKSILGTGASTSSTSNKKK